MRTADFEWDNNKDKINQEKHGVSFFEAQRAFLDVHRVIAEDTEHSLSEKRYYCFGKVDGEVMTVRFTYRDNKVRIIGAGYWRKGKKIYEKEKN
ncbi:BrnT family toxin [Candidiatus Paracoxiella cheracis]|uniref:BrnT family toxin n=1 Tax=Candidiatus Paracoxiella cheracis TaxID=3405120 RepID=UPI003BF4CB2D